MKEKKMLTTEHLSKRFTSTFELVTYSIALARNKILSGRPCRVATTIQNEAYQVLAEIAEDKDVFEALPEKKRKQPSDDDQGDHVE